MTYKLLMVDDEEEIRDLLSRHFRFLGYDVRTAAEGKEALALLEKETFDIVITDIMMPGMDGIELTAEIRSQYPMIKVIVITGQVTMVNLLATIRHGAENIIFKPLSNMQELEETVAHSAKVIERWKMKLQQLSALKA